MVELVTPEPGDVSPWFLLGALQTHVREFGPIGPADWNACVELAYAFGLGSDQIQR